MGTDGADGDGARRDGADSGAADNGGADSMGPQERFEYLVDELAGLPGVTPPGSSSGFGRSALRVNGKIFAMLVRGELVLKLPKDRVSELIEQGHAGPFDANKGTPMREWASLDPAARQPWLPLALEALSFAQGKPAVR